MKIRLHNLAIDFDRDFAGIRERIARLLDDKLVPDSVTIVRRSLDARRSKPRFVYTVDVEVEADRVYVESRLKAIRHEFPEPTPEQEIAPGDEPLGGRPVIVGAGPAGLFAALTLAARGYEPLVLERGQPVERRIEDLNEFLKTREVDADSNVLYGEGGAGTFSDGKLYAGGKDPRIAVALAAFVECGAPAEIVYDAKPHIGTDRLRGVLIRMREKIQALGGEFRFGCRVGEIALAPDGVVLKTAEKTISTRAAILATGNSARDTYVALRDAGLALEPKTFQMGLRIEHPQSLIARSQYGAWHEHKDLPQAEYRLTCRAGAKGLRAVHSFCMCPGGRVIPAVSEAGGLCLNGMSEYKRDSGYANSALVVAVTPQDYAFAARHPDDALAGLAFQRIWERAAFKAGGSDYTAPAQKVGDFLNRRESEGRIECSYPLGARGANLHEILPEFVGDSIAAALAVFERKIGGFSKAPAVLLGVETRVSSPVRIVRDPESRTSPTSPHLYPVGEGAGYAGGIMSAAVDGVRSAEAIVARYKK